MDKKLYGVNTLGKGMRRHHSIQNGEQFKIYKLCIPGIVSLLLLDQGLPLVTETLGSKTMYKGDYYINIYQRAP